MFKIMETGDNSKTLDGKPFATVAEVKETICNQIQASDNAGDPGVDVDEEGGRRYV